MFFCREQPRTDTCDPTKVSTVTSGWGWGSWGAVLNQATNTMTSGLSQVIEKVESTLGIPEPGELQDKAHSKESKEDVITAEPSQEVAVEEVDSNSGKLFICTAIIVTSIIFLFCNRCPYVPTYAYICILFNSWQLIIISFTIAIKTLNCCERTLSLAKLHS